MAPNEHITLHSLRRYSLNRLAKVNLLATQQIRRSQGDAHDAALHAARRKIGAGRPRQRERGAWDTGENGATRSHEKDGSDGRRGQHADSFGIPVNPEQPAPKVCLKPPAEQTRLGVYFLAWLSIAKWRQILLIDTVP